MDFTVSPNFTNLITRTPMAVGMVSASLSGKPDEHVYFATLNAHHLNVRLAEVLTHGDLQREYFVGGDEEFDKEIFALLVLSPWFPLGIGPTPQAALINLIEKVNQPWMTEINHLLRILVNKVIKRWFDRSLRDKETGEFKFHIDATYVVPEDEKGFKRP